MSYLEHYCSSTILFYCCSFAKLCPTLCDPYPMDSSTPDSSVLHYLPEFAQTHVHWIGDRLLLFFSSLSTKCIFCNHITNYILKPQKINLWKSFYVNKNNLLPATYPAKKKSCLDIFCLVKPQFSSCSLSIWLTSIGMQKGRLLKSSLRNYFLIC